MGHSDQAVARTKAVSYRTGFREVVFGFIRVYFQNVNEQQTDLLIAKTHTRSNNNFFKFSKTAQSEALAGLSTSYSRSQSVGS